MNRIKFGDVFILLLILGTGIFFTPRLFKKSGGTVKIIADNKEYQYPLSKDNIYSVQGTIGVTTVEVKNNKVRITDSPCLNKTCVSTNWGNTIICLPNNVIVTIEDDGGFDAIAE